MKLNTGTQIIGLGGYKGSGKNTLGNHLADLINKKGKRHAVCIGLADALKEYCVEEYGLDLEICHADNHTKNTTLTKVAWNTMPQKIQTKYEYKRSDSVYMTYREVLQIVGTDLGRDIFGEDVWLERFTARANAVQSDKPITIVVTDVRFDNEAQYCMKNGGHVIRVMSDAKVVDTHATEAGITQYNYEVCGKGRASLVHSKKDIWTLYGYICLHENVRDFVNEEIN